MFRIAQAYDLAAFEYHHVTEVVGREGSIRAWWSGTLDRTRQPAFELKVKRRGGAAVVVCRAITKQASGRDDSRPARLLLGVNPPR